MTSTLCRTFVPADFLELRATSAIGALACRHVAERLCANYLPTCVAQQNLPHCVRTHQLHPHIWLANRILHQLHLHFPLPSPAILARGDAAVLSRQGTFEVHSAPQFPQSRVLAVSSRRRKAQPRQSFVAWLIVSLTRPQMYAS